MYTADIYSRQGGFALPPLIGAAVDLHVGGPVRRSPAFPRRAPRASCSWGGRVRLPSASSRDNNPAGRLPAVRHASLKQVQGRA